MSELVWTTEAPTLPGCYWFRWTPEHSAQMLTVERQDCGCLYHELNWIGNRRGQWAGPIPAPKELNP
jgi:hypothetical protein